MPLPKPTLDNRDFDQLVAEATARLPRLAPGWTDYNTSDPGITLLELLAARTESSIYRLDRTPPALVRSFLRLAGVVQQRAQCAEAIVIIASVDAPAVLPAGIQIGNDTAGALFQTTEDLAVSGATLLTVIADGVDVTEANAAGTDDPGVLAPAGYLPFGPDPAPDDALYLGFDRALNVPGAAVHLYVWTTTPADDRDLRRRLVAEYDAMAAEALACCPTVVPPEVPDWRLHYSVRTVWEFFDGGTTWQPLADVHDDTRALSLSAAVRFAAPAGHQPGGPGAPNAAQFFVRCRIASGNFECAPMLARIALNAVSSLHAIDLPAPEVLGTSEGHAFERFALAAAPVVPGSTRLTVTPPSGIDSGWIEVADWDTSGPFDRHYVLESDANAISGGNGAVARVFPVDAVLAITCQIGSGAAGNLEEHGLTRIEPSALNAARYQAANGGAMPDWSHWRIEQPFDALGGADAEPLEMTEVRANELVFAASRAVTLDDFSRLACDVPGIPVARAHALADYCPDLPCFAAAGSVTVVVVPACCDTRPVPSVDFLSGVARYLGRRRTVATEVHVIAPCYRTVVVSASLNLDVDVDAGAARLRAIAALDAFFNPLHGGPEGGGWPIGRAVYRAEIMALLAGVDGVLTVTGLGLAFAEDTQPRCGNLPMCPDCLVLSGSHVLVTNGVAAAPIIDRSTPHECP